MSDCCLPNLGCLAIPVISTNVAGNPGTPGTPGAAGNGIASESYDPLTGELELTFTDSTTFTTGDLRGAAGAAGVNGVSRLYSNVVPNSLASPLNSFVTIDSYTLPANTLVNNGDAIIINLYTNKTALLNTNYCARKVTFAGFNMTGMGSFSTDPYMGTVSLFNGVFYTYKLTVEFIKTSATTAISRCYADLNSTTSGLTPLYINYTPLPGFIPPVFDFTQPIPILMQITQAVANGVTFTSSTIDKITKI